MRVVPGSAARRPSSRDGAPDARRHGRRRHGSGRATSAIEEKLAKLGELPPGGAVRQSRISALLLQDAGVVDGTVEFQFKTAARGPGVLAGFRDGRRPLSRPVQFDKPEAQLAATGRVVVKVSACSRCIYPRHDAGAGHDCDRATR